MAAGSTRLADVFNPEVASSVAAATFVDELALGYAGSGFTTVFPGIDAAWEEGDTIKFPKWGSIAEMAALTEDVAMVPERMTSSVDTAAVQIFGRAVEVTDWATLSGRGDASVEAGRQMGILAARAVDQALIVEAETSTLTGGGAAVISWDSIVDALISNWGDSAFADVAGLVVHSKQAGDIMKDANFVQNQLYGDGNALRVGMPGQIGGIPVYVSDRLTVTAGAPDTYTGLILKRGALGVKFQRNLLVEADRDILKKSDVLAADVRFAVHLMNAAKLPVIKITTQ